jgi:hypothetical protein
MYLYVALYIGVSLKKATKAYSLAITERKATKHITQVIREASKIQ